jgi:hypothetical protein
MRTTRITVQAPDVRVGLADYALEIHIDPRPVGSNRIHGRAHIWNAPATGTTMQSRRLALATVFATILKRSPYPLPGLHDEHGYALPDADSHIKNAVLDKAAWRTTAGCSCGCSPGFILQNFPFDVYATFTVAK